MIEIIPWMLVLVWWHPEEPGRVEIRREPHLFADEATCRMYGNERVATVKMYDVEYDHVRVTYSCMPVPGSEEYDRMLGDIDGKASEQEATSPEAADRSAGEGQ